MMLCQMCRYDTNTIIAANQLLVYESIINIVHTIIRIYITPLDLMLIVHKFYSSSNKWICLFINLYFLRLLLFQLVFGARLVMAMERQTTRKNNWSDTFFLDWKDNFSIWKMWVHCYCNMNYERFRYCAELENFSILVIFQIEHVRASNINVYFIVKIVKSLVDWSCHVRITCCTLRNAVE